MPSIQRMVVVCMTQTPIVRRICEKGKKKPPPWFAGRAARPIAVTLVIGPAPSVFVRCRRTDAPAGTHGLPRMNGGGQGRLSGAAGWRASGFRATCVRSTADAAIFWWGCE